MRKVLEYSLFTLSAIGRPSPLWGQNTPLFGTQNNTRSMRTETSPLFSPVIEVGIKLKIPPTHFWPNSLSPTGNLCYYARYSAQFCPINSKRVLQVSLIYILKSY